MTSTINISDFIKSLNLKNIKKGGKDDKDKKGEKGKKDDNEKLTNYSTSSLFDDIPKLDKKGQMYVLEIIRLYHVNYDNSELVSSPYECKINKKGGIYFSSDKLPSEVLYILSKFVVLYKQSKEDSERNERAVGK